jgi:acetoin utilization protein AcuB
MDQIDAKRARLNEFLQQTADASEPLTVAHVMTRKPICVRPDVSAYDLVHLFHEKRFRHLLVTDDSSRLAGVISDRDVLRCFGPTGSPSRESLAAVTAATLMSTDVITIEPQTALADAVGTMLTHGINCLPVVSAGKLCGIVTSTDVYLVVECLLRRAPVAIQP